MSAPAVAPPTPSEPAAVPAAPAAARVVLPVAGMTCAACQARVQRTLARTPGP